MEHVSLSNADAPSAADGSSKVSFIREALLPFGFQAAPSDLNTMSEEFRAIKREVLAEFEAGGEGAPRRNRVMITSINEGEGKTFAAINLARSIGLEQDKHVLLVDANVLSPRIGDLVEPAPETGLIDYLTDSVLPINDAIHRTDVERVRVLTIGSQHHLANELLSGPSMKKLMAEFNNRYNDRVVLFDAPPLLGVNETMTLTNHVDQIILVIEDGRVQVQDLRRIQKMLPKGIKVHYILNKSLSDRSWRRTGNHDGAENKALTGAHPFL